MSIFDVLEEIKDEEFSLIEVFSYPSHLDYHNQKISKKAAERIKELKLKPVSFHAPFAEHFDISSPDKEQRNNSLQEILSAARSAVLLGAEYFVIHPGGEGSHEPSPFELEERMENLREGLKKVSKFCHEHGMSLVLENMFPQLQFGNIKDILYLADGIGSALGGICLDTGHANLSGELYTSIQSLGSRLKIIHANDNSGIEDDHLPPGKGNIDWNRVLIQLKEAGFAGTFILELSGDREDDPKDVLKEAGEARHLLEEISKKT